MGSLFSIGESTKYMPEGSGGIMIKTLTYGDSKKDNKKVVFVKETKEAVKPKSSRVVRAKNTKSKTEKEIIANKDVKKEAPEFLQELLTKYVYGGGNSTELAKSYHIGSNTLSKYARSYVVEPNSNEIKLNSAEDGLNAYIQRKIMSDYYAKKSNKDIAKRNGVSVDTVIDFIKKSANFIKIDISGNGNVERVEKPKKIEKPKTTEKSKTTKSKTNKLSEKDRPTDKDVRMAIKAVQAKIDSGEIKLKDFSDKEKVKYLNKKYGVGNWRIMTKEEVIECLRRDGFFN